MNRKSKEDRAKILHCLVEGNSIRSTARLMDCSKNTVLKLLVDVGSACHVYQDRHLRNLKCERVQADELWSFVGKKSVNKDGSRNHQADIWTYTALCADSKLVPSWLVGYRNSQTTFTFIQDLFSRMDGRVQLTTDGYQPYVDMVEETVGGGVDYAILMKNFSRDSAATIDVRKINGSPDKDHISTSFVERQNLLMRTNIRRFTRKTNAFSKKIENHAMAVSLHFMYYNFVRIHRTLKTTPAMAAGVSKTLWSLEDVIEMSDQQTEQKPYNCSTERA